MPSGSSHGTNGGWDSRSAACNWFVITLSMMIEAGSNSRATRRPAGQDLYGMHGQSVRWCRWAAWTRLPRDLNLRRHDEWHSDMPDDKIAVKRHVHWHGTTRTRRTELCSPRVPIMSIMSSRRSSAKTPSSIGVSADTLAPHERGSTPARWTPAPDPAGPPRHPAGHRPPGGVPLPPPAAGSTGSS
jgi:hypothetical protein